jgi:hypothetical protein
MRQAAVLIGALPVGPTCARRAGLIELGRKKSGFVSLVRGRQVAPERDCDTLDLFAGVEA